MRIILATKSPRRHELIKGLEMEYRLTAYEIEEHFEPTLNPEVIAMFLAKKKADAFPEAIANDEILLTADTLVWINNQVLNKPADEEEAYNMLKLICGKTHKVFTGICLRSNAMEKVFYECSEVSCKQLTDEEIMHYVNSYQPFDKAGSYGIQDWFGYIAVEKINGCFYNVMGLPLSRIYDELKVFKKN